MKFYKELCNYYDVIFPTSKPTVNFLSKNLKENSKILDIACGTGGYSIALAKLNNKVDGIDLSDSMIKLAQKKESDVSFKSLDMLKIDEEYENNNYDLIYCVGNSLVHLPTLKDVENAISKSADLLKPGGEFVVQIINYDRIINNKIKGLPTIERTDENVTLIRDYLIKDDMVFFNTELITPENKSFKNSVPLLPLKKNIIEDFLKDKFHNIVFYGGFNEVLWNEDSFATIVRAVKN